jgi:hypothetical protein
MNREEIIRMARAAGCKPFRSPEHWDDVQVFATPDVLERFAALVAEHEREACARWCDIVAREVDDINGLAGYCAKGIRARGDR